MIRPGRDAIQSALCKILASRPFQGSERMSRFLSFVVDHALRNDRAPLKEHLIAEAVFDRDYWIPEPRSPKTGSSSNQPNPRLTLTVKIGKRIKDEHPAGIILEPGEK